MSRIFEALRQSEREAAGSPLLNQSAGTTELSPSSAVSASDLSNVKTIAVDFRNCKDLAPFRMEHALAAEKFSMLAARLTNIRMERNLKSLLITSSTVGEGKTFVAANVALMLAQQTRKKVLLIEGDLRRPMLGTMFGLGPLAGLGDWASLRDPITSFFYRLGEASLWFLPAGKVEQPAELLESRELVDLFHKLADWFEWVVIDSPPVAPMADSNLWARLIDGTLLVVREGVTQHKTLRIALETLDNPKLLGAVLNEATENEEKNYYHKYYNKKRVSAPAGQ